MAKKWVLAIPRAEGVQRPGGSRSMCVWAGVAGEQRAGARVRSGVGGVDGEPVSLPRAVAFIPAQ